MHRCTLEREVIKGILSQATQDPDKFAFNLMKAEDYTAVIAGDVAHLIHCKPINTVFFQAEDGIRDYTE